MNNSDWKVRFLDLSLKSEPERFLYLQKLDQVLTSGHIVLGQEVSDFEESLADFSGRRFAVGVGSGSDAVLFAVKALGLPPDSEIITTPLSWVASTNAILLSGMKPVFADIDETLNINVDTIEPLITSNTRAILAVDFAGQPCNYDALLSLCRKYNLFLIQDASQALGAEDNNGKCGSHGDISAVSHNPMKTLSAFGEAGSVLTNSEELADFARVLRYAGTINREDCIIPSTNGRMDTIQAAFLSVRLNSLQKIIARRNEIADKYNRELPQQLQRVAISPTTIKHAYYTYQVRHRKRDDFINILARLGIETKVQHRLLIPYQGYYRQSGYDISGYYAEEVCQTSLCLPCNEKLQDWEQDIVIEAARRAIGMLD